MHQVATDTPSHVPPRRRGIIIAIFHNLVTNFWSPKARTQHPGMFVVPTAYLIAEQFSCRPKMTLTKSARTSLCREESGLLIAKLACAFVYQGLCFCVSPYNTHRHSAFCPTGMSSRLKGLQPLPKLCVGNAADSLLPIASGWSTTDRSLPGSPSM